MRTGLVVDQPMVELFGSLAAQRASGRLDVLHGKRKRQFWFEGGKLKGHKSNLKSESAGRLQERHPELDKQGLLDLQGRTRVLNALKQAEGEWSFEANDAPSRRNGVDLPAVVWEALDRHLDPTLPEQRLAGLGGRFPTLKPQGVALHELPLVGVAHDLISDLDGQHPLDDVLEFSPVPPELASRATYLAMIFGLLEFGAAEAAAIHVNEGPPDIEFDDDDLSVPDFEVPEVPDDPTVGGVDEELVELRRIHARIHDAETHFDVIGVRWDDDPGEMRKAYFALAQKLHPDRWQSASTDKQQLAGEVFAKVTEAWDTLGDDDKRQAYIDKTIHGLKSEDELAMEKVRAILAAEETFKHGLSYFQRGNIVKAHELFELAHTQVPEEPEFQAYYAYAKFRIHWGKDDELAQEGVNEIKAAIDQATKLDSGWVLMGLVWRTVGQPQKSLASFKKALEMNPSNVDAERELRRAVHEYKRAKAAEKKAEATKKGLFGRFFGGKK